MSTVNTQSAPGSQFGPCFTNGCNNHSRWISIETPRRLKSFNNDHCQCPECCDNMAHLTVRDQRMSDVFWELANRADMFALIDNAADCTEAIELVVSYPNGQAVVEHYKGGYLVSWYYHDAQAAGRTRDFILGETQHAWAAASLMIAAGVEYD